MYRTIVVGTDCSPTATTAVMKAAELAKLTGAKLYLVSAYPASASTYAAVGGGAVFFDPPDGHESADERGIHVDAMARGLRAQGIEVETRVEAGGAASTLVRMADTLDADLLVVGDRGLKGLRGVLGSVPSRVTHRARLDILVVHTT
ncbi:MAG TPA: universal stress protein [Acidimicrobiales bacterium]|nr:universal stress protein [Acidimicrobiales bacterium]